MQQFYPKRCAFEIHEVRRVPISQSDAVRQRIVVSSEHGRLFPQALSEYFGKQPDVERLDLDVEQVNGGEHVTVVVHSHVAPHTWTLSATELDRQRTNHFDTGFDHCGMAQAAVASWHAHCQKHTDGV
ncbi:MAG TPA: hypothetical protein VFA10_17725 [Ktedonobacteraceae bacterium]|nr:hypothetical protein [Ktedonobacteraceae bacterium]